MKIVRILSLAVLGAILFNACASSDQYQAVDDPNDGANGKTKLHRAIAR